MSSRLSHAEDRVFLVVGLVFLALFLSPTTTRAVTFADWAAANGYGPGAVLPQTVSAQSSSIDVLTGLGAYNWTTTPTECLDLHNNQIAAIAGGTFSQPNNLTHLDLSRNAITSVESGDYMGLDDLATLLLSHNQIATLNSGGFSGLDNATSLQLDHNQITSIPNACFSGLSSLTYLGLSGNQIVTIPTYGLDGLGALTSLDLHDNLITTIEEGCFRELDSLDTLDLRCNSMTSIPGGAFSDLGTLTSLNLSWNSITSIDAGSYMGLGNLTSLRLHHNAIATLGGGGSSGLSKLTSLDLSGNPITTLQGGFCVGFSGTLTVLNMSDVDFASLTDLTPLYDLDSLTDLWLARTTNVDAMALDTLLDNLAAMQSVATEGVLYLTQADYTSLNTSGAGRLAAWDAEPGHHVQIVVPGDANGDGSVDETDALTLAAHWGLAGMSWWDGDFNDDGFVGAADAAMLAANWNYNSSESCPIDVPEPASFALLAMAAAWWCLGRRRF
ncbi:MAG: leucine-rich repeat domain-containing protein [Pirellulales bacterium]|nr:leucine-rich repeat domain-containing protein [Pirellulales bacterium]